MKRNRNKNVLLALVVILILIIAYLHYSTGQGTRVHEVYAELHYIPVLLGALVFGLAGAALASTAIAVVYMPYLMATWSTSWLLLLEQSIHVLFPALFGFIVGFLVDLERKQRTELERNRYLAGLGQAGAALVHDLRNLVITVKVFSKRIEEGKGDARASAQVIGEAGQRIEEVIESTLSFGKPISLDMREEDLAPFINELRELASTHAERHGIRIVLDLAGNDVRARIDRALMRRALLNVVTNAIEASTTGQQIRVSASRRRDRIIIEIRDDGEGMDLETLENLFIPFYSKKTRGTGLGMAITKKVVEEHGGTIKVISKKGVGTRVTVSLPIRPDI